MNELPTTPGVYTQPSTPMVIPQPSGTTHLRDVGNYRLCTHTDEHGVFSNWQRELPDGEWVEVLGFPLEEKR